MIGAERLRSITKSLFGRWFEERRRKREERKYIDRLVKDINDLGSQYFGGKVIPQSKEAEDRVKRMGL